MTYSALGDLFDLHAANLARGRKEKVVANIDADDSIRTANERVYNMVWSLGQPKGAFLCECDLFCTAEVSMTAAEYVGVRDRGDLVYAPGHMRHKLRHSEAE